MTGQYCLVQNYNGRVTVATGTRESLLPTFTTLKNHYGTRGYIHWHDTEMDGTRVVRMGVEEPATREEATREITLTLTPVSEPEKLLRIV